MSESKWSRMRDVGICDVTTLGKIDIKGPDSAEFLNRIYTIVKQFSVKDLL